MMSRGGTNIIIAVPPEEAGLTLIEMLIVLSIIAISAGAIALGIGATTRQPTLESEARALAALIQSGADDAMLGDRLVALTVDEHGYGFASWDGRGWVAKGDYHDIPSGMVVTFNVKPPVMLGADGSGQPMIATVTPDGGRASGWRVRYDGLTAVAEPVPAA